MLTKPFPTDADRFRRDVEWEPMYSTYREGFTQIVEIWENGDTIRKNMAE